MQGSPERWVTMTTAAPWRGRGVYHRIPMDHDHQGRRLCEASGATAAAIVVASATIPEVPILPKRPSRTARARQELEPQGPEPAAPPAPGPQGHSSRHPAAVTFSPAHVQAGTRGPPP